MNTYSASAVVIGNILTLDGLRETILRLEKERPRWPTLSVPVLTLSDLGRMEPCEEPCGWWLKMRFRFERAIRRADLIDPPWRTLLYERFVPDQNVYLIEGVGAVMHPEIAERLKLATQ